MVEERFQGGDAYSNASARVWDVFDTEHAQFLPNELMLGPVPRERIASALARLFDDEAAVQATPKQRRISDRASAVVRMAYSNVPYVIASEEVDHVTPFERRNAADFPVAINHPANLMPLARSINAKRKDRYLSQVSRGPHGRRGLQVQDPRTVAGRRECSER